MKSKKEFFILGIIIVALAAYLFLHKTDRTHYKLPAMVKLDDTDITSIKITKGDQPIDLTKKDDKWLIYPEKFDADKDKIEPLVKVIKNLTLTAMVSETESYHRYQLDPENRIHIEAASDGKVVRTFDIGKAAPLNRHTFVKLPDDKRVYHARENFRSKFDRTRDDFRDKTVLTVDKAQVQQVEITDKENKPVLTMKQVPVEVKVTAESTQTKDKEKKNTPPEKTPPAMTWQDGDGNPVKDSDINNFFNNVKNLKCQSYIEGKSKADFTAPLYTVTITGAKTVTLSVFDKLKKDDNTYPAISSENDYPFMLPAYKMDNMVKK